MDTIGVVDTMFARYDMGAEAVDELEGCPGFGTAFEVVRREVAVGPVVHHRVGHRETRAGGEHRTRVAHRHLVPEQLRATRQCGARVESRTRSLRPASSRPAH